ncbi:MAG: hypothetical protein JNK82_03870 [Myxococcaceae bacterium]|nr:hypothetical protein [Myxococcaceae bacterium]
MSAMLVGLKAQVETGATLTEYLPSSNVPGGFTFAIPEGPYLLDFTSGGVRYGTVTSAATVDLGYAVVGRTDATYPQAATPLTLNLTGLVPWSANDGLGFTSTNLGVGEYDVMRFSTQGLEAGATAGAVTFDYRQSRLPMLSAARGDTLVLTQRVRLSSPLPHWTTVRSATVTGLTQTSGQSSTVNAVFSAMPPLTQPVDLRTTQFESHRASVHPQAVSSHTQILFYGAPGFTPERSAGATTAILLYAALPAGGTDFSGSFTFVNPFSVSTPLVVSVASLFSVAVQAPGAAAAPLYGVLEQTLPLASLSGPLTPLVGPPRMIQVNGVPVTTLTSGVGQSPVITWAAPAIGAVDYYLVTFSRLVNQAGETQIVTVATFGTKATRLVVPPNTLQAGQLHMITVSAFVNRGIDFDTRPFQTAGISSRADAVAGPIVR